MKSHGQSPVDLKFAEKLGEGHCAELLLQIKTIMLNP